MSNAMIDAMRDTAGTRQQAFAGALAVGGCLYARAAFASGWLDGGMGNPAGGDGDFQPPMTRIAGELYRLHPLMLILCALIFVGVFGVMVYSILAHRRAKGREASHEAGRAAVHFHRSTTVEIIWTAAPFVIVALMALPAARAVIAMRNNRAFDAYITIRVTDYQQKWRYEYIGGPGKGIQFLSAPGAPENAPENNAGRQTQNGQATRSPGPVASALQDAAHPLVVPVDEKIRLIVTSGDVAFSWYVPSFDVKRDVVSQFTHDMWFKVRKVGIYHGFCAGQCDRRRTYIPVVIRVLSIDDYAQWVDAQKKKIVAGTPVSSSP